MAPSSKPNVKVDILGVLRALKPLLLLIIPIAIMVLNHYLIVEHYPTVAKWINYTSYGMCGLIGLWVLIRLAIYLNSALRLWRRGREEMRQDPLFVTETKMRARIKEVHAKLRRNDHRMYDVPFYAVIGQRSSDVEAVLLGSGIAFPKDLKLEQKKERHDRFENWYIGNEAVFVDVTALQAPEREKEWKVFLKVLASVRTAAPLNGVLVVLPSGQLRIDDARRRKALGVALQKNLHFMQGELLEEFPVYLLVSNVDKLDGFQEFFGDIKDQDRGQMLGWSGKGDFRSATYLETLKEDVAGIKARMDELMRRRLVNQTSTQDVDQIYTFVSEFKKLNERVLKFVERVFDPETYLEPLSLRGFYYLGGISVNLKGIKGDFPLDGHTVIGDGRNMGSDSATVVEEGVDLKTLSHAKNWFSQEFFLKKLIPESGTICRPKRVLRKQAFLKVVSASILAFQVLFLGGLLVRECGKTADWREESAVVIERAQALLGKNVPDKGDSASARQVLEKILKIKEAVKKEGLFKGATSIGLSGEVTAQLDNLHKLVYQKYFLRPLIGKVETDIASWDGNEKAFVPFANKLIEYIRWANPKYSGKLSIDPFVSQEKDAVSTQYRKFLLKHFIKNHTDDMPRMTDNSAVARISKALEQINGSARITIPLESGPKNRLPGESEWEWWQRLGTKLSGFSGTTQKLLKVQSPFEDREDKNINDQIFYATKMVGQLTNTILEMEGLIEEGKEKLSTWISSYKDFFPELKAAAADWPPMLAAIDKCEMRSESAYEQIAVPLFNKEMAWVQTFVGVNGGPLTGVLDDLLERKTKVGKREVGIYREIGEKYLTFLKSFNGYLVGFGDLIKKSGAIVSYSTYYSGEELVKKLETVRKELAELTKLEAKATESAAVLDNMLAEVEKEQGEEAAPKSKKDVKKNLIAAGKDALSEAIKGVELKRQVLTKFYWLQISEWLKKWQPGLKSEKAYLSSLYWMELFDWYKPFTKSQMKGGSYASILRMNLFAQKTPEYFTEDIERFLDDWLASVPVEIQTLLAEPGAIQKNPGLKDFDILYNQVKKFKEQYLPQLRQAAVAFVSAVNLMEPDAKKTWRKLADGSEPELNWDALEAFSKFKSEYEIKEGIALRNITGSLEEVQIALSKTLNGELGKKFNAAWNAVVRKLRARGTDKKFPFVQDGPSASKNEAMDAVKEFVDLGVDLGILQAEDGTSIELTGQSQKIMDRIVPAVRRRFLAKCAVFKTFLGGEGEQMPEVVVALQPGEIGKHYHWIRMFIGRLRYFDLSVYGDKKATIDLASTVGNIKFMGLDVEKSALAQQTVNQGELGLLQLTYSNGRSMDKDRTKWRVTSSLASASSDGEQITFDLMFTYSKSLPPLPILPG